MIDGADHEAPPQEVGVRARANISLSGKKHKKLLQQIRLAQKEKAAMEVEAHSKSARLVRRQKEMTVPQDPGEES